VLRIRLSKNKMATNRQDIAILLKYIIEKVVKSQDGDIDQK